MGFPHHASRVCPRYRRCLDRSLSGVQVQMVCRYIIQIGRIERHQTAGRSHLDVEDKSRPCLTCGEGATSAHFNLRSSERACPLLCRPLTSRHTDFPDVIASRERSTDEAAGTLPGVGRCAGCVAHGAAGSWFAVVVPLADATMRMIA
eukprot:6108898-Prymnesium_polylepis.1